MLKEAENTDDSELIRNEMKYQQMMKQQNIEFNNKIIENTQNLQRIKDTK